MYKMNRTTGFDVKEQWDLVNSVCSTMNTDTEKQEVINIK